MQSRGKDELVVRVQECRGMEAKEGRFLNQEKRDLAGVQPDSGEAERVAENYSFEVAVSCFKIATR